MLPAPGWILPTGVLQRFEVTGIGYISDDVFNGMFPRHTRLHTPSCCKVVILYTIAERQGVYAYVGTLQSDWVTEPWTIVKDLQ